jgi:hypothetical protein
MVKLFEGGIIDKNSIHCDIRFAPRRMNNKGKHMTDL